MDKHKIDILINILEDRKLKINHRFDNDTRVRHVSYNGGIDDVIEILNQIKEGQRELKND